MIPRTLWAHWTVQALCFVIGIAGIVQVVSAQVAAPAAPSLDVSTVLGSAGAIISVLVAKWSANQEKAILKAQQTADKALETAQEAKHRVDTHIAIQKAVERMKTSGGHELYSGS